MLQRDEFLRQLDRWLELMREESLVLYEKGLGPDSLMRTASQIADARLSAEVRRRADVSLAAPNVTFPTRAQ